MNLKDDNSIIGEIDQLVDIGLLNGRLSRTTVIHLLHEKNAINEYPKIIQYMLDKGIVFTDDDIEYNIDDDLDRLSNFHPFDPTKINIAQKSLSVEGIIKRLNHNEIDMKTFFQRKSGLWDSKTKSQLIESLMLRIPLPVFYFDGTNDDKWLVIDGLQRLTTFKEFFIEKSLKLSGMEYFTDYNGCGYDDIPRTYIRRMEETQLFLYIIQPGTPQNVKFNIFKRINTPGLKLEPQEIRHALYQGKATDLLKRIAESEEFLKVTDRSISNERMLASEIVLRYFAFVILGERKYEEMNGQLDLFLNETMQRINDMDDTEICNYEREYYKTIKRVYELFDIYSFRKISNTNNRKNPFNVALYESWMINLRLLSEEEFQKLKQNKNILIEKFISLLDDKTFGYDISSGKRVAVLRRIKSIKNLIGEIIYD